MKLNDQSMARFRQLNAESKTAAQRVNDFLNAQALAMGLDVNKSHYNFDEAAGEFRKVEQIPAVQSDVEDKK